MAKVQPATFGGRGRNVQAQHGGLANLTFASRCPPDLQPNTRIIALCGITDYTGPTDDPSSAEEEDAPQPSKKKTLLSRISSQKWQDRKKTGKATKSSNTKLGLASPKEDGWFISDFYLFRHLFRGLGKSQLWLTCEHPKELVKKYETYGHGDPDGDHRAVLDASLLPGIMATDNIRVSKRSELMEDFIRTFRGECEQAAKNEQPILLMVFGHGDSGTYGIAVGGAGQPRNAPRLQTWQILASLRGLDVSLTILLTSCYSGGWILQPQLNITALTAAGPKKMSEAYKASVGGQSHGSLYATAIRLAFIKMEDERATQIHPYPNGQTIDEERLSTIYAELTNTIHTALVHDVDRLGSRHQIKFAAQNDEWEFEWRKRSGSRLAKFQEQWNQLPILAVNPGETATLVGQVED